MQRNYVWADGQALAQIDPVTTLPPDLIVDNTQATFTGTWATSTSLTGFYGANYRSNAKGTGKDKAVWTLNVPSTGSYQVYARWVAASTHASNAPFTIKYSGGSKAISINQRTSGGQWMLLGSFAFTAGSVTVTDNANGTVIADAIKLTATTGGTTSEAVRYLHGDHLGTPRLATNQQGQKIWSWEGSAFGSTPPNEDPDGNGVNTVINLRFAGMVADAESGNFYGGDRYWDQRLGRSITADNMSVAEHVERWRAGLVPGQPPLEINPYAHVLNNPLRWIDSTGFEATVPSPSLPAPGTGVGSGIGSAIGRGIRMCWNPIVAGVVAITFSTPTGGCDDGGKCSDTRDDKDKEKNCRALYDTIVRSCWSISDPRRRQRCFEAAKSTYEACMAQD